MSEKQVHLQKIHNDGETEAWCGFDYDFRVTDTMDESPETVTCETCLRAVLGFAEGCALRLRELSKSESEL